MSNVQWGLAWLWRRVTTWTVAAWFGLGGAGSIRPNCSGAGLGRGDGLFSLNLFEREMRVRQYFHEKWVGHLL